MPAVAAIPAYVGKHSELLSATPPGHRFGLYFSLWNDQNWKIADKKGGKQRALKQVLPLGREATEQLTALRQRQSRLAEAASALTFDAESEAPFMTGVGMEHPLENGFAFLNPYGLPYLPGASVKGVLRQAAEALALEQGISDRGGWDIVTVWWLFGFDATSVCLEKPESDAAKALRAASDADTLDPELTQPFEPLTDLIGGGKAQERRRQIHRKGALAFWDVFPEPAGSSLAIDILTPHYALYYQKGMPPADCYAPTPVPFLTLPPASRFRFHVHFLDRPSLPASLRERWQTLIDKAFDRAFDWHGFGAKTAVGYGQMRPVLGGEEETKAAPASMPQTERQLPKSGTRIDAVLSERKTKKGGWMALHEESSIIGPIQNTNDVPADKKPGDRVTLMVFGRTDFRWPTEADEKRAAAPKEKSGGKGKHFGKGKKW